MVHFKSPSMDFLVFNITERNLLCMFYHFHGCDCYVSYVSHFIRKRYGIFQLNSSSRRSKISKKKIFFKGSINRPKHCYEPPKRIFESFDFYGNGSRFCLSGQKSLKSPILAFTPKQGLIWTQDPNGPSFAIRGQPKASPRP